MPTHLTLVINHATSMLANAPAPLQVERSAIAHVAHAQADRACAAQAGPARRIAATERKIDVPSLILITFDVILLGAAMTRPVYAQMNEAYTTGEPQAQQFAKTTRHNSSM